MRAHPPTDAGEGIRLARQSIGLFKPPFGDQPHISSRIGMCWARHHAGEICVQPITVDFFVFESLQHCGSRSLTALERLPIFLKQKQRDGSDAQATAPAVHHCSYFVRVKSALPPPATVTGLDWAF